MDDAMRNEVLARGRVHRLVEADRLRELREQRGLGQSDVARYLDVAASNVSRWEAGHTRPTGAHAVALLKLLDGLSLIVGLCVLFLAMLAASMRQLDDRVLKVPEAAKLLGVSQRTYYEAAKRGEVPARRVGRRVVVPGAALRRFLEGEAGERR